MFPNAAVVKTVLYYFQLVVDLLMAVGSGSKNYRSGWGSCSKRFMSLFWQRSTGFWQTASLFAGSAKLNW